MKNFKRKNFKKWTVLLAATVMAAGALAGCGGAKASDSAGDAAKADTEAGAASRDASQAPEGTTVLLASHVFNDSHPWQQCLEKLSELLYERTDGRYTVEVHPAAGLSGGSSRTLIEMVGNGGLDIMVHASLSLEGFNPNYGVFALPFLFEDREQGLDILNHSEVGAQAMTWLESNGITGVALCENGTRYLANAVRPVRTPEDLAGLKIRVPESEVLLSEFKAWGADPTPMNMTEVYTAIQQGTVDGNENNIPAIDSNKLYEVCPYITTTAHCWEPAWIFFNSELLDSLSEEDREIFIQAAKEAAEYEVQLEGESEEEKMKTFVEYGCEIIELTPEERAAFKAQVQSVYDEYRGKLGSELVDSIVKAVENY